MFLSYVAIILLLLTIYSLYIFIETKEVGKERQKQYFNIKLEEIANSLDTQFSRADSIVANINSSDIIENCILAIDNGSDINEDVFDVNSAIKTYTHSANNFNIVGTYLFIDGLDKVFSNTVPYALNEPFTLGSGEEVGMTIGSMAQFYGISHGATVFNKTYLMYITKYGNIMREGRICILFDKDSIFDDLKTITENVSGIRISIGSALLYENGDIDKSVTFKKKSLYNGAISYTLVVDSSNMYIKHNTALILMLVIAFALGLVLIIVAFVLASQYYEPVGNINRIMSVSEGSNGDNEFENIISGIESLIGERNGYREKMVSIKPYAKQGMLYGIMNGSLEPEKIDLLLEDEYTVLKKPYFTLAVINVAYVGQDVADEKVYKKAKLLIEDIAKDNSGEDIRVVTYDKDINNMFVIVNSNVTEGIQDIFYRIYTSLVGRMDNPDYAVTIGVDAVREDIGEITMAVNYAFKALENIMVAGRGAVYFAENDSDIKSEYYFPKDTLSRVTQALKAKNTDAVRDIFQDIIARNTNECDLTPGGARLIVDEIHITTVRAIRETNMYNNLDFNIRKPDMVAPLEEIMQYYYAIYEAICERIDAVTDKSEDMDTIDGKIIECIDKEFADANMSLQYLTERFGVSNKYITLLCKKRLGKTYLAYIQDKRINYAIELMRTGKYSLEKVADMCGYTNLLTFRRNFKAVTGVNPSEYNI